MNIKKYHCQLCLLKVPLLQLIHIESARTVAARTAKAAFLWAATAKRRHLRLQQTDFVLV